MSAPYPWIKDSGDISGAPTGRLAISSSSGLYLSTSTNSSILGPTNADISIESQGTGDIILKTNSNNRLIINDSGDVTSSKNLIVNNSLVGGSANPSLTLNLTNLSGTTIVEEVYNQRTASNATSIYEHVFNAKNSAGTKFQYASIIILSPSITSTSSRGAMTFTLRDSLSSNSIYLQLDGINSRVTIPRLLVMQNNILMNSSNIQNCSEITAPSGSKYTPQFVQYLNSNGTFLATAENNTRQILISIITGTSIVVDLSSSLTNVVYAGGVFSNNITLFDVGSTCQTIYNQSDNRWYVLSIQGNVQFN